ncbi:GTP-binding protein ERG [Zea mays]|uniref:GTP-binding protein ERG n=1 Tax=Zea mays TaxID=4577 RepID=A0A1D6PU55_MAIZE|nr:GTP-binding protein ERG [Zea mays]
MRRMRTAHGTWRSRCSMRRWRRLTRMKRISGRSGKKTRCRFPLALSARPMPASPRSQIPWLGQKWLQSPARQILRLMLGHHGFPYRDVTVRVESAWSSINLYDLLIVMFDVNRHLNLPDSRVIKLIKRLGTEVNPNQRRILCMNKVDLVEDKKDLLKVAKEFEDLPGYERYFMVSGLKGKGVKDLVQYLMEQAVRRPWDEEPTVMTEEVMKTITLEVVREKMLHHIHQEIPYVIEHRLMGWKELKDGSLRVEQHFIAPKQSQRQILVGKNGSKIGRIGIEANEELRSIFKRDVHLILQVRVAKKRSA